MTEEKIHLVVNHLPLIGLFFSLIPLAWGVIGNNASLLRVGWICLLIAGISTPVVMWSGEAAHLRYIEGGPVAAYIDEQGIQWANLHYQNAEKGAKASYLLILASIAGLVILWKKTAWARIAGIVSVVLGLLALALNVWIADSGGKIRRPDFRGEVILEGIEAPEDH